MGVVGISVIGCFQRCLQFTEGRSDRDIVENKFRLVFVWFVLSYIIM